MLIHSAPIAIMARPAGTGSYHYPTRQLISPPSHIDVPTIVHNLIRDMQALEAALYRWGSTQATPDDVSNCYVQFGVEFNAVVQAFKGYDIPTSDLHAIPAQLRLALEECLGEEPSPVALDRYLPDIRKLLSELLLGLRAKHPAWRNAVAARPPTAASNRSYSPGDTRSSSSGSFP